MVKTCHEYEPGNTTEAVIHACGTCGGDKRKPIYQAFDPTPYNPETMAETEEEWRQKFTDAADHPVFAKLPTVQAAFRSLGADDMGRY
jgi:hypothetical protein